MKKDLPADTNFAPRDWTYFAHAAKDKDRCKQLLKDRGLPFTISRNGMEITTTCSWPTFEALMETLAEEQS